MKLNIHVTADLALPTATPTTMQIEAAELDGAHTVKEGNP